MDAEGIIRILREGLYLVLLLSAGPMLASLLVGLVISIFQATTQIQEQTLTYVPKLVSVFLTSALLGPWMLTQTVRFAQSLFDAIVLVR